MHCILVSDFHKDFGYFLLILKKGHLRGVTERHTNTHYFNCKIFIFFLSVKKRDRDMYIFSIIRNCQQWIGMMSRISDVFALL